MKKRIAVIIAAIALAGTAVTVSAATAETKAQAADTVLENPLWDTVEKGANW